ncbi:MAG: hemolysin family protein [Candidatus Nanopelagicales bacterium]
MSQNTLFLVSASFMVLSAAIFVATETALTRVSKATIDQLRKDGSKPAARLSKLLDDRAKYVNSLMFAHLTLSTIAIVLVTTVSLDVFVDNNLALVTSSAVMVLVGYIVLGVAPQTLGRQRADRIALATVRLARMITVIFGPLSRIFILVGNAITPGQGFREGPFSTQAELRELVDMAGADSVIEDDERQMIHSVFELGDTIAREVMVPRTEMVWIETHKTLRQAMSLGLRSGYSRIPVVGEGIDDIVGVVYVKDIARRVFEHQESQTTERVSDLMRPAFMVPDSRSVDELLRDMQSARTHLAVLVDEYGGTAGLVTIEDVIEEIVGEISDEHDVLGPDIEELANGEYRVSSRLHIDDLAELLETEIPDEGVDTVGGLMAKRLGIVPIPGATVDIDSWTLTAESTAGRRHRIDTVVISRDSFTAETEDESSE